MDNLIHLPFVIVYPSLVRTNVYSLMALSNDYGRRFPSSTQNIAHSYLAAGKSSPCNSWHPELPSISLENHQICRSPLRIYALSKFECALRLESRYLNSTAHYLQNGIPLDRFYRFKHHVEKPGLRQAVFGLKRKEIRGAALAACRCFLTFYHPKTKTVSVKSAYISPPPADHSVAHDIDRGSNGLSHSFSAEEEQKPKSLITAQVLRRLLWKEKKHLFVATVALLGATSCTLTMPIFSGRFFEALIGACPEPFWKLLAKLSAIYALEPVCTVLFITNMITAWERIMANLRSSLFRRLILQKVEFFDKHKVGELTTLISTDLGALKDIIHENVSRDRGFRAISETFGTLLILYIVSPQLAPILGILMLCVSTFAAIYRRKTFPAFMAYGQAQACISDCANETFAAIRTVRSFGGEKRQISAFDKLVFAIQGSGNRLGWLRSLNESCTRVVIYVSLMALYILGGMKVKAGELAVGNMVSFIGYTFVLTFSVQGVVNTLADVRATVAAVDRINSIVRESDLDESLARGIKQEAKDEGDHLIDLSSTAGEQRRGPVSGIYKDSASLLNNVCDLAWSGDIVLEDVHFSYPSRPDVEVLKGVNLVLNHGTITAVVGSSGAGKSTIVQLLARFYEPSKGRLTLSGEDVRQFSKIEWARAVSIVNQEPILFAVSIAENIAYGLPNEEVPLHEVVRAAKAANAHDFVVALPQGYETLVGERGSLLSGGQRQRIAIARALLKNSPILILDEATSALDSISERLVQDALDHLMKGRTTLVIAHRLSTVQKADNIAVCADGQIIEVGSHSELLAQNGAYSALVNTQRLTFE